ncbi:MAG: BCCT family transporter [Eubacteriaceae bacterium]
MNSQGETKKSNTVLIFGLIITLAIVAWGVISPGSFEEIGNYLFAVLTGDFGWFYTASVGGFLVFSIWIGLSKYGNIKLGADDSKPEYSTTSWFAMLFSAGMGIGLIFWGVAEPLNHFMSPLGADPGTGAAAEFAIEKSFLHWGLHPWACFAVMALALAFMQFRKNKKGQISSIFIPLVGEERVNGWFGKLIDILAIFATVAGVATSLGLGTMQINSGLSYLFGIPESKGVQIAIILIVTCLFILSAVSGIGRGIKILSNINMILATAIVAIAFIIGPKVMALGFMTEGIGNYFQSIVGETFAIGAFSEDSAWYGGWTVFYWAWWIAWAPFVGSFIARISKGRTIREFVGGVLLVPALLTFIWFGIFGALGINLGADVASEAIQTTSTACFVVFSHYPLGTVLSLITLVLVCTFFITSADSATFVLGVFSSDGNLDPSNKIKIIWGLLESALALVLLVGTENGLSMLQSISIVGAFPFAFVMLGAMVALFKLVTTDSAYEPGIEMEKDYGSSGLKKDQVVSELEPSVVLEEN